MREPDAGVAPGVPPAADLASALRRCGLFRSLSDADLHALALRADVIHFEGGEDIIREGDVGDVMYVVLHGAVQVHARNREGHETVLARLETGEHFGEQALLPGRTGRRSASVRAAEASRLARVPKTAFQAALAHDDALREHLVELGNEQVRAQLQRLSPLAQGIGLDRIVTVRRSLIPGEVLFRQGDEGDALYFVSAGRLAVWQEEPEPRTLIRYVDRGGCVGELALVRRSPRSATVVAEEPTEVLAVSRSTFDDLYRDSAAVREHVATLERVYELPRRGIVTQHAGRFAGYDCVTTIYHLADGRVFAAYRVVGQNLYALERLDAGPAERIAWAGGDRSRELRLGPDGVVLGLIARGEWPDAQALHLFVLDGGRIQQAERDRFARSGVFDTAPADSLADVVCHCVHVTAEALRIAIAQGRASFDLLQASTGCGTVCGGCVPAVTEMLGAEEWVLADVVGERDEAPGIRSFELAPRRAGYPAGEPGQHVVVEGLVDGLRVRRPYTLSSAGDRGDRLRITVKREPGGAFSPWLFDARPKDQPLRITYPRGHNIIDLSMGPVVCLVAGIGVTPAVAAARTAARDVQPTSLIVHYSGRARPAMACVEELEALVGARVALIVRETSREGRLDAAEVARLVSRAPDASWYLCGPPAYLDQVAGWLVAAGVAARRIHVEAFTAVGRVPRTTSKKPEAWTRGLLVPPAPAPSRSVVRAMRRVGGALVSLVNSPLTDWQVKSLQLNPLRWLERGLGRAAALDPAVPQQMLAMIAALSWGPFDYQVRAFDRLVPLGTGSRERVRRARAMGRDLRRDTADGNTFTYWMPSVRFPRFPASCAVHTGWSQAGPGRLVPVYVTRSRTALERLLRRGEDADRAPVPYHFVQQITGRRDIAACQGRKASGLIAGSFRDNATWSEDRALAADMFGVRTIDAFGAGMAEALVEACATIDDVVAHDPEGAFDLGKLLSHLARTMIVRALFGDADRANVDTFGQTLAESVQRLLGRVSEFVMGRQSVPRDFPEAHDTARVAIRRIIDLLRDLDRRDQLTTAQRALPSIRRVLDTAGAPDGGYESLAALFLPLIIAGHETTAHTLSWALCEMARQPHLEAPVLAEIERSRTGRGQRPLGVAEYDERPMSLALLAETLRRHPPIRSVSRTTVKEGVVPPDPESGIGSFRYPAGATIIVSIIGAHLDPARWESPLVFEPARWLQGVRSGSSPAEQGRVVRDAMRAREHALDWIPFADGSGRCPGQYFTIHECLLVLDALLPRYRFELVHPTRTISHSESLVVGPEPGSLAVRIRPRQSR